MPEAPAGRPARTRRAGAREAILDAIRTAEPLSRVELAAMTGLTEASVSTTVRRLLDEGLVVETGRTPTGGKPRTLLRLDPGARVAVGVHLDEAVTTYVLTGQTGGVVSRMTRPAAPRDGQFLHRLVSDIERLVAGAGVDRARCLGIGLVRPGPHAPSTVENAAPFPGAGGQLEPTHNGVGVAAAVPGDLGKSLADQLSAATGWPVLVENDATAAAVGEFWVARAEAARSFAALYMGSSLGAGIVLDGVALRGRQANAGEFGHLCLQLDGPACWCGSRGCLEALAGPQAVVEAALASPTAAAEAGLDTVSTAAAPVDTAATADATLDTVPTTEGAPDTATTTDATLDTATAADAVLDKSGTSLSNSEAADSGLGKRHRVVAGGGGRERARPSTVAAFAAVARAARSGAPACRALLDESARYVAAAAESVVNLLDVDLVILTGPGFAAASFVYGPAISARLYAADTKTWHRSVSVTVSPAAATASATGAAALVIQSCLA